MPNHSQRFAQRVLAAFREAGNRTDAQVIQAKGPSTSTMTKLRKVAEGEEEMTQPREPTWTNIDSAANWPDGTARRVWDDPDVSTTQTGPVGGNPDDDDSLLYRRPDNMSDAEWRRLKNETREYLEWLIDRATRER